MAHTCENCAHFKPYEDEASLMDEGWCKRYPPALVRPCTSGDSSHTALWAQPFIHSGETCGEWVHTESLT